MYIYIHTQTIVACGANNCDAVNMSVDASVVTCLHFLVAVILIWRLCWGTRRQSVGNASVNRLSPLTKLTVFLLFCVFVDERVVNVLVDCWPTRQPSSITLIVFFLNFVFVSANAPATRQSDVGRCVRIR